MCFLIQDPAGIFELVEVVGNGTYGQVYKVGVSLHLFACQSLKRERGHWNRKRHYFCFSKDAKSTRHPHVFVLVSGLDYLWFSFCFVSTRFSKAYIISVPLFMVHRRFLLHLLWPTPISDILCMLHTLQCTDQAMPVRAWQPSARWPSHTPLGGRCFIAHLCTTLPSRPFAGVILNCINGDGPVHPITPTQTQCGKSIWGRPGTPAAQIFTDTDVSSYTSLLLPGRNGMRRQ